MEQVQTQVKAQASKRKMLKLCEIFYNQALLNIGSIQQIQEMAGPYDDLAWWGSDFGGNYAT